MLLNANSAVVPNHTKNALATNIHAPSPFHSLDSPFLASGKSAILIRHYCSSSLSYLLSFSYVFHYGEGRECWFTLLPFASSKSSYACYIMWLTESFTNTFDDRKKSFIDTTTRLTIHTGITIQCITSREIMGLSIIAMVIIIIIIIILFPTNNVNKFCLGLHHRFVLVPTKSILFYQQLVPSIIDNVIKSSNICTVAITSHTLDSVLFFVE